LARYMTKTALVAKLDTPAARKKMEKGATAQEPMGTGKYLAYRRGASGVGTWWALWVRLPDKSKKKKAALGKANDANPADGKKILDYRQAKNKALEWFARVAPSGSPFTVADALDAYFRDGERRGMKGIASNRISAMAWIVSAVPRAGRGEAPPLGGVEVANLDRTRIENWLDDVASCPKRLRTRFGQPQKYAPPPATDDERRARRDTANRILTILKAALTFAIDRRLVCAEPSWQAVRPYRGTTKARIRFLSQAEQVRLASASQGAFGDLLKGALLTGCRYSELAKLERKDYRPGDAPTVFIAESKSGRPRHIVLTTEGAALFDALSIGKEPSNLLFTNGIRRAKREARAGSWLKGDQRRPMLEACRAAGIDPITFHELRHTHASMLVNNGCPLFFVASQLGHVGTRMVEKHYGHIRDDAKVAAILAAMPTLGIMA
jgi:integrase